MGPWKVLTEETPVDHEEVWVRINYWFGQPCLATWHSDTEEFITTETGLTYPSWVIMRWAAQ